MSKSHKLMPVLYLVIVINILVMISDYKVISNKVGAFCTLFIVLYMVIEDHGKIGYKKNENRLLLSIVFFIAFFAITSIFKGSIEYIIESVLYYLIEFSSIFIFVYFLKKDVIKKQRILLTVFFVFWNLFCILAIYNYIMHPYLARMMAADRSSYYSILIGGGYPMAYGSAVLGVFLFQNLLEKKISSRYRFITILEIVVLVAVVYLTNSFIVIVAMLSGFFLCVFGRFFPKKRYGLYLIVLFTIIVVIAMNIDVILEWMLNANDNEFIEKRLFELYDLAANDVTSNHINKRTGLYEMSVSTFVQHPLIGVGYSFGNTGSLQRLNGVGAHSTILDSLAQYGILGSLPLFGIIVYPFIYNKENRYSSVYLFTYVLMLLLNPSFTTYHLLLVVYLVVPLLQNANKERIIKNTVSDIDNHSPIGGENE